MDETARERARLMRMAEVFDLGGWQEIKRELQNEIEVVKDQLVTCQTEGDMRFLQGRIEQMVSVIFLDNTVQNILNAEEEADADV